MSFRFRFVITILVVDESIRKVSRRLNIRYYYRYNLTAGGVSDTASDLFQAKWSLVRAALWR